MVVGVMPGAVALEGAAPRGVVPLKVVPPGPAPPEPKLEPGPPRTVPPGPARRADEEPLEVEGAERPPPAAAPWAADGEGTVAPQAVAKIRSKKAAPVTAERRAVTRPSSDAGSGPDGEPAPRDRRPRRGRRPAASAPGRSHGVPPADRTARDRPRSGRVPRCRRTPPVGSAMARR